MERCDAYIHHSEFNSLSRDTNVDINLSTTGALVKSESKVSSRDKMSFDEAILSTSSNDFPPNIAISPGSCKSPYCCTSPGFCNFPFHTFKTRHFSASSAIDRNSGTNPNLFTRDQVFVPDSAEPEPAEPSVTVTSRRFSVPLLRNPLPLIKADQLSLPELKDHGDLIDSIAPVSSFSPSSSPASSNSSLHNDNLDVTSGEVMVLLRPPKQEVVETGFCFGSRSCTSNTIKKQSVMGMKIRRSPPPPNVTLSPDKHLRNNLPPGNHFKPRLICCKTTLKLAELINKVTQIFKFSYFS